MGIEKGHEVYDIGDVTKEQLARFVNEQTEAIKALRVEKQHLVRVLCALALEPEAFTYQDGKPAVAQGALEKVTATMMIKMNFDQAFGVRLEAVDPGDIRRIVTPRFTGGAMGPM